MRKGPSTHVLRVNAGYEIWIASIVSIPHLEEVISFKKYLSWKYSSERQEVDQSKWGIHLLVVHIYDIWLVCVITCALWCSILKEPQHTLVLREKSPMITMPFPAIFSHVFGAVETEKTYFWRKWKKKMVWNGPESHSWRTHILFCKKKMNLDKE